MGISRRTILISGATAVLGGAALSISAVRGLANSLLNAMRGRRSVEDRVKEFGGALDRLEERFREAGQPFPPERVVLAGIKAESRLDVYAGPSGSQHSRVTSYPILAASGTLGPKTREGDRQVPEGVYDIESVNPNSRFHVSLRIGYPNRLDLEFARQHGHSQPGGDIMIHGGAASIGCLAMGDAAAEELFVLAVKAGLSRVKILLSPVDLRRHPLPVDLNQIEHRARYDELQAEFRLLRD